MIFLSLSGIFICVQSCASISTLALAQQCPHDFAEPFQTSGSSILWCVLAEQTLHSLIDLKEEGPEGGGDILLEQP